MMGWRRIVITCTLVLTVACDADPVPQAPECGFDSRTGGGKVVYAIDFAMDEALIGGSAALTAVDADGNQYLIIEYPRGDGDVTVTLRVLD